MLAAAILAAQITLGQTVPDATVASPMMPLPAHAIKGTGSFSLNRGFNVTLSGYTEPRLERARARFLETMKRQTGIRLWPQSADLPQFVIQTKAASAPVQNVGEDESYRLEVTPTKVLLRAENPLGIVHGLQTFLQLIHVSADGFAVSAVVIDDKPRFPWRGLMIDTGRHFMPAETILHNLDGMEAVKLNVLHWHVSEDQGFRVESKLYPRLQGMGSDGLYYTQAEVRSIVEYARDRGIRVVPEFELPSHASSMFIGYPELADGPGSYRLKRKLSQKWERVRDPLEDSSMDPTHETTYKFLDGLIGEMAGLFPDPYFHVGGDAEDAIIEWGTNPRMQQYMKEHNLKDTAALQNYFTGRVQKLVAKHHKTMVGWDEVLSPELSKDVVIQSWRGLDSLTKVIQSGHHGLLSWGYYLDLSEPASRHYAVDPFDKEVASLTDDQRKNILGGEAAMWTEYVTAESLGGRIWPRAAVVAERLWSPREVKDVDSMYARLDLLTQNLIYARLPYLDIRERMYQRMIGANDPTSLKVLASVLEPPRGYPRGGNREYTVYTPLNHLSDAVPAESDRARAFRDIADRIAAGTASPADWLQARAWLTLWRDNDATLQPMLRQSNLTVELVPLSQNLAQMAVIGLLALDSLEKHAPMDQSIRDQSLAKLKEIGPQQAELTNAVIPGVETLVRATKQ